MTLIYAFCLWMLRNTEVDINALSVFFVITLMFDFFFVSILLLASVP